VSAADPCAELDDHLRAWKVFEEPGLMEWLRTQQDIEPCIASGLREARDGADWNMFERYLIAAAVHPSTTYTPLLCEVLDERRDDMSSEAIVDALDPIADPAAVDCLRRAIGWIPDWDEYGQMARKAVYALDRIGTPEATAAIREEVTDDLPFKVVEAAAEVLKSPYSDR
jgi:hypothetical protein